MDELDKKIESTFKSKSNDYKLSNKFINRVNETLTTLPNKRKKYTRNIKVVLATSCCSLMLVSGIVFAKDIQEYIINKFKLGKGIQTAVENGYIAETNNDYLSHNTNVVNPQSKKLLNDINLGIKINTYLIDNSNLSLEIKYKFDNKLKEIVNIDNLQGIELLDLIIIDDEKRILYDGGAGNKEIFENYCKENNLNYTFGNCSENYLNSGLNVFESFEETLENEKSYIYNFYVEDENYPKSKKLNLIFTKISFNEASTESVVLNGNWNIELDIPEKMYNRVEGNYSVIKCENDNFDIYAAKLTETGFELGLKINGLENPEYPIELAEEEKRFYESVRAQEGGRIPRDTTEAKTKFYNESPYKDLYENYYTKHFPTSIKAVRLYMPWIKETEGCYIRTSDGNKFYISESGCSKQRNSFNEDGTYEFYNKFDMTQYDATDNITAVIELYGLPVKIYLKRTN